MIVAITGINSGLGKALVSKLQNDPDISKIIGIDLYEFEGNNNKVESIKLDIRDKEGLMHAFKGIDVIIHLAFIVIPKKLPKNKVIYDINVNGAKSVFQAAAKNNAKQIIHLSSQSVYGHVPESPMIVNEDSPRLGIKTTKFYYAHTKALVEEYLDEFEKEFPDIKVVRLRPPIITGPHFMENLGLFINDGKNKTTVIPANHQGKAPLQFIHEDDLTDVIIMAIKQKLHGAYNVGGNFIPDIIEFMEKEYNVQLKPLSNFLTNFLIRIGRIYTKARWILAAKYNSLLNTEKIKTTLNWKPKYTSEDCIREINKLS